LKRETALPSGERGPVDFCALRRFALALARMYPLCCAQHNGHYVEHGIMLSSGRKPVPSGVLAADRPT